MSQLPITSTMVQAAMDSLFGEYTNPGNDQAWITPDWMEAKAKVRSALEAAILSATQPSPSPVAAGGYALVPVKDAEDARDLLMLYGSNSAWRELSERFGKALAARPPIGETVPGAGWQPIETAPKDGDAIAVWIEGTPACRAHVFSPVSITEEGDWWDDSTGDQIEPIIGATYWMRPAPPIVSTQEGEAP